VAHIKYISFLQADSTGKLRHPTPVPAGPGGINFTTSLPFTEAQAPPVFQAPQSNAPMASLNNSSSSLGDDGFVILHGTQRISDLHVTKDSVFKVTLRKRDKQRKRKRGRVAEDDPSELKRHNEELQQKLKEMTVRIRELNKG